MSDRVVSLHVHRLEAFRFSRDAASRAEDLFAMPPAHLFHALVNGKESEAAWLAAKRVVDAVLAGALVRPPENRSCPAPGGAAALCDALADELGEHHRVARRALEGASRGDPRRAQALLRERALIGLLGTCWLERISQPATQPADIVNMLFAQYFRDQGAGVFERALTRRYRRALEEHDLSLPSVASSELQSAIGAADASYALGAFYVALGMYSANHLPEVIGLDWAFRSIGTDALLTGRPLATESVEDAQRIARAYVRALDSAGTDEARALTERFVTGVRLGAALESWHIDQSIQKVTQAEARTLDERVAEVFHRHAKHAGKHHRRVRVAGRTLVDILSDERFDELAFVAQLKSSPFLRTQSDGGCRFLAATKFGGPMFGVFNEEEAALLGEWARTAARGEAACSAAERRSGAGRETKSADAAQMFHTDGSRIAIEDAPEDMDVRELLFMLANIENFPCVLPVAKRIVLKGCEAARRLFSVDSAATRYTCPTYFEYSPEEFVARMEAIYRDKLVTPYEPLRTIPSREDVIFQQKISALGNLIDGAWLHRVGSSTRERRTDVALFSVYADEMGRGDVKKNHIKLIYDVLASMGVELPHIADAAFREQDVLLDDAYLFAIFQLSLAQFPEAFYPELIGYNLAIEMYGLGEMRMHEIEKLRHWGFDTAYAETHLSIDNMSAGHARASMDIVVARLEQVKHDLGEDAMRREWERIWLGYASFAQFVEKLQPAEEVSLAEHVI